MNPQHIANGLLAELAAESSMRVGATIRHPDGRMVKVVSGQYLSNGRVSNFWEWREVRADGSLGPVECGYGW